MNTLEVWYSGEFQLNVDVTWECKKRERIGLYFFSVKSSQYNNFHSLRRVTNFKQGSVHYKPHRQNLDNFDPFTLFRFLRARLTYINFGIKIFRLILKVVKFL